SIRGGICQSSKYFAVADNKFLESNVGIELAEKFLGKYEPDPQGRECFILDLDVRNLYGYSMMLKLPYKLYDIQDVNIEGDAVKPYLANLFTRYGENYSQGFFAEVDVY